MIVLRGAHVRLGICVRKWHALRLIFRAMDIRGKLQGKDPGTTRRDKDRKAGEGGGRERERERERER